MAELDLKEVMDQIKKTTDLYAAGLEPDGDWQPMLFIVKDEKMNMIGFFMPESGHQKEELFMTKLPNMIQTQFSNPDAVIMLVSAWMSEAYEDGGPPPRHMPDRREALLLQGISQEKEMMYMGEIIRSESHPELEWIKETDTAEFEGRLVGCLRRAVWT